MLSSLAHTNLPWLSKHLGGARDFSPTVLQRGKLSALRRRRDQRRARLRSEPVAEPLLGRQALGLGWLYTPAPPRLAFVCDTPFGQGSAIRTAKLRFLRPSWAAGRCLGAGSQPGISPGCCSLASCEGGGWGDAEIVICSS